MEGLPVSVYFNYCLEFFFFFCITVVCYVIELLGCYTSFVSFRGATVRPHLCVLLIKITAITLPMLLPMKNAWISRLSLLEGSFACCRVEGFLLEKAVQMFEGICG